MDRYIGRLLDNRYEILEIVGTGGMAVVYKARCHRLNRLVAIKILKDEFSRDDEFRRRFHAEGQAVAMLSHPNIVSVYDVSSSETADYIVMELIDGISLKQYMEKKGVLNWKETLHFAMQIAKALEHAHSHSIVHRDIKPHNVMVLKNGSVKVMDFGIARVMSKSNTLTKEALGSVHYISPEQAKGSWVDNRSDLYSLSVVMYEMMTGRPPYDGESPVAVAIQHINGGALMPSTLNPNIPGGMEQIIMKGMALDAKDRFSNATEMLRDMDEFRKDPGLLFDYNKTSVDDATRIIQTSAIVEAAAVAAPRTMAERAVQRTEGPRTRSSGDVGVRRTSAPPQRSRTSSDLNRSRSASPARSTAVDPARRAEERRRRREREEEKRSRMATIAIVACSAVAALAIIIFLVVLIGGGMMNGSKKVEVPDLLGKVYANIDPRAYDGLEIELRHSAYSDDYAKGQIMNQEPAAGLEIAQGNKVYVDVSMGVEPSQKTMEDLVGLDYDTAVSFLAGQNLNLNPLPKEEHSDTVPEGKIIRTDPKKGELLEEGQTIKLYVSTGPIIKTAKVPNVIGLNMATAKNVLAQSGFNNVEFKPVASDKKEDDVVDINVTIGDDIDVTTKIILYISEGPAETQPPEKPTDPPASSENTAPPSAPTVTKRVTILPPARDEAYSLGIMFNGVWIVSDRTIEPGSDGFEVTLAGSGKQSYDIYIDGTKYGSEEVDFTTDG